MIPLDIIYSIQSHLCFGSAWNLLLDSLHCSANASQGVFLSALQRGYLFSSVPRLLLPLSCVQVDVPAPASFPTPPELFVCGCCTWYVGVDSQNLFACLSQSAQTYTTPQRRPEECTIPTFSPRLTSNSTRCSSRSQCLHSSPSFGLGPADL